MMRVAPLLTALGLLAWSAPAALAQDFPQLKINHVDTSKAPKITIYGSLLGRGLKPIGEDDVSELTLLKKPEKGTPRELFSFVDKEVVWPKSMSDEVKAEKDQDPPILLPAIDAEVGAAIVVVVPGFQDDEYRQGTLGQRSRSGAGLFFKKLGKTHRMNAIWYNDFVWSYVYTKGRTTSLTKLDTQLEKCARWARDELEKFGQDAGEEEAEGPKDGEANCGLTPEYGDLGDYIARMPYQGFWPQMWGIEPLICAPPKEQHAKQTTGLARRDVDESNPYANDGRVNAMDAAIKMLVEGSQPGQPKILIITGDGRDGYVYRHDDCTTVKRRECEDDPALAGLGGRERRKALKICLDSKMNAIYRTEQTQFKDKLDAWLGLAKAAGIRVYTVAHPTAKPFQAERLSVLAWRSGGTARVAEDANEVVDHYEELIGEINSQFMITFGDEDAVPGSELSYVMAAKTKAGTYKSKEFTAEVAPTVEKPFLVGFQQGGEDTLGPAGFLAVVIVVALLVLIILLKVGGKIFKGGGEKAAKKAKKGGKGGDKAKAKLKEKAAKDKQKAAKKKAKLKAKLKKKKG